MNLAAQFIVLICFIHVHRSLQSCRVLGDCNQGQAQWINLGQGGHGPPGERGPPGPRGQKGEPGPRPNTTEIANKLKEESKGPRRYFYISTMTWQTSKLFCENYDQQLCTFDQICPINSNGGRKFIDDVIPGDHWVPVMDSDNEWIEIGDVPHPTLCFSHKQAYGAPAWGTSIQSKAFKGFVYCCPKPIVEEMPDIRYQFIGKTATYGSSKNHCESQGLRLCHSSEICHQNKPKFGILRSDKWAPVNDQTNEWVQIGNSGRTCGLHGSLHGLPSWGERKDGSSRDYLGYVYCCKDLHE